ncbi:GNAT family N-acetyltransferase [Roseiterribacter gracilis]|uniref:N-acetyltransferase n=1 Tax=Roseiterribacter gracilis TaxID=2812848 RepID=A0A8S8X7W9_9PROT|nr:N-acetyltransferase [Rhodospirillales bacterium TMPK1]
MFQLADYDAAIAPSEIARIWHTAWRDRNPTLAPQITLDNMTERAARFLAEGRWTVRVARLDGMLVGFCAVAKAEKLLDQLFILPSAQGRGIGSALLREAQANHPDGLQMRVQLTNHDALRLYARHGFVEYGRETHPVMGVEMALLRWPA